VRLLLSRAAHASGGLKLKGSAIRAFTPSNPEPQDEAWWVFLTDPANNHVVAFTKVGWGLLPCQTLPAFGRPLAGLG
jgi:hypothetical protein